MAVTQQQGLERIGQRLLQDPTGANRAISNQVLDAAHPTISGVIGSITEAGNKAAGAYDAASGTIARQQRALGQTQSARDIASQQRRIGLRRALARVNAGASQLQSIRQRTDIARLGAMNLRDIINSQELSIRGQLAQNEGAREQQYQQELAAYDKQRKAAIGALVGVGLSFAPGGKFLAPAVSGAIANG